MTAWSGAAVGPAGGAGAAGGGGKGVVTDIGWVAGRNVAGTSGVGVPVVASGRHPAGTTTLEPAGAVAGAAGDTVPGRDGTLRNANGRRT